MAITHLIEGMPELIFAELMAEKIYLKEFGGENIDIKH